MGFQTFVKRACNDVDIMRIKSTISLKPEMGERLERARPGFPMRLAFETKLSQRFERKHTRLTWQLSINERLGNVQFILLSSNAVGNFKTGQSCIADEVESIARIHKSRFIQVRFSTAARTATTHVKWNIAYA